MRKLEEALPVTCMTGLLLAGLLFSLSCGRTSSPGTPAGYDRLKEGFANPSGTARPKVYWWWLNGYTDTLRLREELRAMKEAGIGGADIFEIGVPAASDPNGIIPAGPAFMSPASLAAIKFALSEAEELGLEMGLNLASSWNAGGSWVEPEDAAKTIYYSKTDVGDASGGVLKLSFPEITPAKNGQPRKIAYGADGKPVYYREIAVVAIPSENRAGTVNDTTGIVNVSGFFNAESQQVEGWAPGGSWTVYRFICANSGEQLLRPSPNSLGPIIDHFDSVATRKHLMYFINHLQPLVGDFRNSALKYFYLASYEAKEFAWTPSFPEAFRELNGYDVYKFLPALFDPERYDAGLLERFSHDFSETFSELMISNHYGKAKEICNRYGLKIISESGGPGHMHHIPVETLKALGALDIPRGEFWYKRPYYSPDSVVDMVWLVKEIAAASHIYKRDIVEEEAFTSYRDWQEGPADLKPYADRAFCEGMNRLVIHGFPHNPMGMGSPGIAYFAGTHYNDKRVWWPKIKPFNDYLARISYILQKTGFVADVLYYYGEDIPNLVPPKNTRFAVGAGYDYEMINSEVLLKKLQVEDGELVLPGISRYKVLYIGEKEEMSLEVLEKLHSLAEQGATILGGKPVRATGLNRQADAKVKRLGNELWTAASEGGKLEKGKIYSGMSPLKVLQARSVPSDFNYADNQADQRYAPLDYIHYRQGENDFYLVRNTTDRWVSRQCTFRQHAKVPEIWDPVTGEIRPVNIYRDAEDGLQMPLSFPPYGSYFVVFSRQPARSHFTAISLPASGAAQNARPPLLKYTNKGVLFLKEGVIDLEGSEGDRRIENVPKELILDGSWELRFPEGWGAPASAVFPDLVSWTEVANDSIRYFSGTATYYKTFDYGKERIPENSNIYLDLGDLAEVGEVWLNDQSLGITWARPYLFDITGRIREGENTLRIEVANTWSNRLTGDALQGTPFTRTNIVKANKNLVPWEQVPLKESGLLGPVSIHTVQLIQP